MQIVSCRLSFSLLLFIFLVLSFVSYDFDRAFWKDDSLGDILLPFLGDRLSSRDSLYPLSNARLFPFWAENIFRDSCSSRTLYSFFCTCPMQQCIILIISRTFSRRFFGDPAPAVKFVTLSECTCPFRVNSHDRLRRETDSNNSNGRVVSPTKSRLYNAGPAATRSAAASSSSSSLSSHKTATDSTFSWPSLPSKSAIVSGGLF